MVSMLFSFLKPAARRLGVVCCFALSFCPGASALRAAEVEWKPDQQKLSADLRRINLGDALKAVGGRMGWNVLIEPGLEGRRVSTRFTDLALSEALRRIMGDLNYALIRGKTAETSKLLVYATSASKATKKLDLSEQVVIFY